jgi:CspA family cold shock protein
MPKGTIKRLVTDRGFGFIGTAVGTDIFFHRSDLQGVNYSSLREGQQVEFEVASQAPDSSCAIKVRLAQSKSEHW